MPGWNQVVEVLRQSIFAYAQACNGNLGFGILIVTFLARLALLPLGIRLAKAAQAHQRATARLQPELDRIKAKYRDQSARVWPKRPRASSRARSSRSSQRRLSRWPRAGSRVRRAVFERAQRRRVGRPVPLDSKPAQPDLVVALWPTVFTFLATLYRKYCRWAKPARDDRWYRPRHHDRADQDVGGCRVVLGDVESSLAPCRARSCVGRLPEERVYDDQSNRRHDRV